MKREFSWRLVTGSILVASLLAACTLPDTDDPFLNLPSEERLEIHGEIFPFDISVATRATHRLESEGKLVALLASDIIPLEDFEGREATLTGVERTEKMRQIFWVEDIDPVFDDVTEAETEFRFDANDFSFVYPAEWEFSTLADGSAHFSEKNDPARRVFFTFSIEKPAEKNTNDPNILISNLAGVKKAEKDELDRDRQNITLFSNLNDRQYKFFFLSASSEFEKKKAFFRLLNSFIEGEEKVRKMKESELREKAEQLAARVKAEAEQKGLLTEKDPRDEEKSAEKSSDGIFGKLFRSEDPDTVTEKEAVVAAPVAVDLDSEFTNLIDEKAFHYASKAQGFTLKVPYGFWFRNFGPSGNRAAVLGFASFDFATLSESQLRLEIINTEKPVTEFSEVAAGDEVIITFPRNADSYFQLRGPSQYRDAMRSIQSTVAQ